MKGSRNSLINPGPWKCGFKPGDVVRWKDEENYKGRRGGLVIDHFEEYNEYLHFKNSPYGGYFPHRFELDSEFIVDRILTKYSNDL